MAYPPETTAAAAELTAQATAEGLIAAVVRAGGSRQVVAAASAALLRVVQDQGGCPHADLAEELELRQRHSGRALAEKMMAGAVGRHAELSGNCRAARNVAQHVGLGQGADTLRSALQAPKRAQRGRGQAQSAGISLKEKDGEIKHKDLRTVEFNTNQPQAEKKRENQDLETKMAEMETTIKSLAEEIKNLKSEIAEMKNTKLVGELTFTAGMQPDEGTAVAQKDLKDSDEQMHNEKEQADEEGDQEFTLLEWRVAGRHRFRKLFMGWHKLSVVEQHSIRERKGAAARLPHRPAPP